MTTEQTILQAIIDASKRLNTVTEATLEKITNEKNVYRYVQALKRKGVPIQHSNKGRRVSGRSVLMYEFWIPENRIKEFTENKT